MYAQYDEKGKIFTNVVSKKPLPVILQTITHLVRGNYHVRPEERIKDALEKEGTFLALTEAEVLSPQAEVLYRCAFMTINKSQIIWIIPEQELIDASQQE